MNRVKPLVLIGIFAFLPPSVLTAEITRLRSGSWDILTEPGERRRIAEGKFFILWEERLPNPGMEFRSYDIIATLRDSTEDGRWIDHFEEVEFRDAHQVGLVLIGGIDTVSASEVLWRVLPTELQPFDSHFLNNHITDYSNSNGLPFATSDRSNPGGLPEITNPLTFSGIGDLLFTSTNDDVAFFQLREQLPVQRLARIVLFDDLQNASSPSMSRLDITVGGDAVPKLNGRETDIFVNVVIGESIFVPEPKPLLTVFSGIVAALVASRFRQFAG